MKIFGSVMKVVLLMLLFTPSAYAYLDPGTMSMILQGIVAGIMVVATTLSLYWHRFLAFLNKLRGIEPKQVKSDDSEDDNSEDISKEG
jgi:CBS domain containing-hemolysin-like protein